MNQIFISHSTRDAAVVTPIVDALQSQGLKPWYDVRQLTPGDDLDQEITDKIAAADQFVVVLSRAAMEVDFGGNALILNIGDEFTIGLYPSVQTAPNAVNYDQKQLTA